MIPGIPIVYYSMRALYRVRYRVSIFTPRVSITRDSRSPEEKPITVDRPNRTYVFYLASEMKFDTKDETRDEHARAHENRTYVISGGETQNKREA